jgi:hypothetical protein
MREVMFQTIANTTLALFTFCFIVALLLISAGDSKARISDRLKDRDWAARQTKKNQPRGGSA